MPIASPQHRLDQALVSALFHPDVIDVAAVTEALTAGANVETPIDFHGYPLTPLAMASMLRFKDDPGRARTARERILTDLLDRNANVSVAAVHLQSLAVDAHNLHDSTFLKRSVDALVILAQHLAARQQGPGTAPETARPER